MTPQELYDKAREWAKEDGDNAYIVLTQRSGYTQDGEVKGSYRDIACMLREVMRRDKGFRVLAKLTLQDLDAHPEDCIDTNGKEDAQ